MKKLLASFLGIALMCLPVMASAVTVLPTGRAYSGDLTITSGTTTDNATAIGIVALSNSGVASTTVSSTSGFAVGNYVMLIQMGTTGAGNYEFLKIRSFSGNTVFFYSNLVNTYQATKAQMIKVSEYHNVTITGGTWTAGNWSSPTGGILVAFLTGALSVSGTGAITAPQGFQGGNASTCIQSGLRPCNQGDSSNNTGSSATGANGMGGGGGQNDNVSHISAGGGGGGYGGAGSTGSVGGGGSPVAGVGGSTGGNAANTTLFLGGGGGGGSTDCGACTSGSGGAGSGIIFIVAASTTVSGSGTITANGVGGGAGNADGGGGGSGGAIRLAERLNVTLGSSVVTAAAGANGGSAVPGGAGGVGRISTLSGVTVAGTASPSIDTSSTDYVYNIDNDATQVMLGTSF